MPTDPPGRISFPCSVSSVGTWPPGLWRGPYENRTAPPSAAPLAQTRSLCSGLLPPHQSARPPPGVQLGLVVGLLHMPIGFRGYKRKPQSVQDKVQIHETPLGTLSGSQGGHSPELGGQGAERCRSNPSSIFSSRESSASSESRTHRASHLPPPACTIELAQHAHKPPRGHWGARPPAARKVTQLLHQEPQRGDWRKGGGSSGRGAAGAGGGGWGGGSRRGPGGHGEEREQKAKAGAGGSGRGPSPRPLAVASPGPQRGSDPLSPREDKRRGAAPPEAATPAPQPCEPAPGQTASGVLALPYSGTAWGPRSSRGLPRGPQQLTRGPRRPPGGRRPGAQARRRSRLGPALSPRPRGPALVAPPSWPRPRGPALPAIPVRCRPLVAISGVASLLAPPRPPLAPTQARARLPQQATAPSGQPTGPGHRRAPTQPVPASRSPPNPLSSPPSQGRAQFGGCRDPIYSHGVRTLGDSHPSPEVASSPGCFPGGRRAAGGPSWGSQGRGGLRSVPIWEQRGAPTRAGPGEKVCLSLQRPWEEGDPHFTDLGASPSHRRLEPLGRALARQVSLDLSPSPVRRLSPRDPWAAAGAPTAEATAWAKWAIGQHLQTRV
ncbi:collagen, type I, alpha 1a-like [Odocoileus virginianus]|uniref:Collagen, type I, alpha 1a-like n=1 Tax=Odocoileus virginianus TaxID=9874 RepID=A0ABM4HC93_ODOVR